MSPENLPSLSTPMLLVKPCRSSYFVEIFEIINELAVLANFVLPKNVSLGNDYTVLQKVQVVSIVYQKAP